MLAIVTAGAAGPGVGQMLAYGEREQSAEPRQRRIDRAAWRFPGRGVLHVGHMDVPIRARHVTDVAEARTAAGHLVRRYRANIQRSSGDQPLTLGEQATFELLPAAT